MTRDEFAKAVIYLEAACGKPIADNKDAAVFRIKVYYDMLGDLPIDVFMAAAKSALLEPLYNSFPSIALLRRLAVQARTPECSLSAGEAWLMATTAIAKCDVDIPGSVERAFATVPAIVVKAVEGFGFRSLYTIPPGNMEAARAQFTKLFESLVGDARQQGMLPPALKKDLEAISVSERHQLPSPVRQIVEKIGVDS